MKEKFIEYLREVGLRYAITWAKYERVRLSTVQLWCSQATSEDNSIDTASVARIYMQAAPAPNSSELPSILRKQAM